MSRWDDENWTSTAVAITGDGEYPHTEVSVVFHKKDLSNLGEPYLSAVKAARAKRALAKGQTS